MEWAERVLSDVETVVGKDGPWNAPSYHAEAFRVIAGLRPDSAATSFQRVYQSAHPAGKIYALAGLLEMGNSQYATLSRDLKDNRDWVLMWQYDDVSCVRAGDFVNGSGFAWPPDIESGRFYDWLLHGPPEP